ncbi:MAG TPA: hypothetical protein DDY59_15335 [Lachnospiraceae bacterium]|nr:hypothetical protein [Lachnospiraceae bacterium]
MRECKQERKQEHKNKLICASCSSPSAISNYSICCDEDFWFKNSTLKTIPFDIKEQLIDIQTIELDEINRNTEGYYKTKIGMAEFDYFLKINPASKVLYVMLRAWKGPTDPVLALERWTYYHYLQTNFIAVNNPMYKDTPSLNCGWYLGSNREDYIAHLVRLIKQIATVNNIPAQQVIFFGSSSAGTAAIHASCYFPNTISISINPQILPNVPDNLKTDFLKTGIDINRNSRMTSYKYVATFL